MPKFEVEVCWRTVHTQWGKVEVEAEDEDAAEDAVSDMADNDDIDWGKEEVVDGEHIYHVRPVKEDE